MNNWKVIPTIVLTTVLIFGAGVFTGGVLVDYVKQAHPRSGGKHGSPSVAASISTTNNPAGVPVHPPPLLSKDFLQRLESELPLTKEQHEAIQKIISDNQNLMRKVVQDTRLEIREVLKPGQRQQFDEIMKRPFHKPLFGTNQPPVSPANAP